MTQSERRTGACLCGVVTFAADLPALEAQACHCIQCQRWTGGGPLISVRVDALSLEGEEHILFYRASAHGERAVCGRCGSTLFWRMQNTPPRFMAVGLFDDQSGIALTEEIFVDYRPDWLPAQPGATQSTEAQEMAKLQAWQEAQNAT